MTFHVPNQWRVRSGVYASTDEYGNNGAFLMPILKVMCNVIASDGEGWEHVSVSLDPQTMGKKLAARTPTWEEMDTVKRIFWDDEDCVVQMHPPRSNWINFHNFTLHLWRQIGTEWAQPDSMLVGPNEQR
jgi:hypothetical protein